MKREENSQGTASQTVRRADAMMLQLIMIRLPQRLQQRRRDGE